MPAPPERVHYLRDNRGERTPHRFLVLDCEAHTESEAARELQTPRLWAARLVRRHDREPGKPRTQEFGGLGVAGILEAIAASLTTRETLWLFCHNLSYDLALTRLPLLLLQAGFEIGRHNLASEAPWAYLKKGSRSLRLADSWSWLPTSVEKLGELLTIAKPALPAEDAPESAWMARCAADVGIVATAMESLMDEWDNRRLGWWSLTGPASGWNSLLHFHSGQRGARWRSLAGRDGGETAGSRKAKTVIDPNPIARAFEREAIYSGRRDLWRVGKLPRGPYVELDLKTAHLAICAAYSLPYRRWKPFSSLALDDWRISSSVASVVASVVVSTSTPRYPLRLPGAVVHPVGTFQTTLAGPEIADARRRGELVSIGHGYGYHTGPHMQEWAEWALGVLNSSPPDVPELLRVLVKGWSRTVPGRWGMTISREVDAGTSHVADWSLEPALIGLPPRRGFIFHLAGKWSECVRDQEAEDSFPAVLAHIQSHTRLLLGRLIEGIPEGLLVSCNTEGLWTHAAALAGLARLGSELAAGPGQPKDLNARALELLNLRTAPLEVQLKKAARTLRVLSPQHLEADGTRHLAGVPRSAVELGADKFAFWTWPKLAGQIERGDPRGYVRELRKVDLSGLPVSRWAFECGCCEPLEARWDAASGNEYLEPPSHCQLHLARLRASQHPALRRAVRR